MQMNYNAAYLLKMGMAHPTSRSEQRAICASDILHAPFHATTNALIRYIVLSLSRILNLGVKSKLADYEIHYAIRMIDFLLADPPL